MTKKVVHSTKYPDVKWIRVEYDDVIEKDLAPLYGLDPQVEFNNIIQAELRYQENIEDIARVIEFMIEHGCQSLSDDEKLKIRSSRVGRTITYKLIPSFINSLIEEGVLSEKYRMGVWEWPE